MPVDGVYHVLLPQRPMVSKHFAMVTRVDDQRMIQFSALAYRVYVAANVSVNVLNHRGVVSTVSLMIFHRVPRLVIRDRHGELHVLPFVVHALG